MTTPTEEELITQALAVLDMQAEPTPPPPPSAAVPAPTAAPVAHASRALQEPPKSHPPSEPEAASPTLQGLDASRRPRVKTVCESCPNSVWFTSPAEVKCYCRVMFLITWSSKDPQTLTACDGVFLGQEE